MAKLSGYLLLLLPLCLASLFAVESRDLLSRHLRDSNAYLTQEEHWFDQTLDHFSPTDHRKFGQRFYEYVDYYQVAKGPIFLKICGESACKGIVNDYLSVLAKKFGAAIVSLEHRYYGKSSPFKILSTDNLRFLSSKQALFDLAVFRQYYQEYLNVNYNLSKGSPWFVFGVSYSGALSAWFRLKFPHLTCGSLASSAVVLAVYNFTEFDQQVGESAGAECKSALQQITYLVDEELKTDSKSVKKLFAAAELKSGSSNLVRHRSSPAGVLSHLNANAGYPNTSKNQISFSSIQNPIMSQISEVAIAGSSSDDSGGYIPRFPSSNWENFSRGKNAIDDLNPAELEARNHVPTLTHQFSLPPKPSPEMVAMENYLHFQDSVPCKIRAKRGCATHPRSIAERVRRTRISERIKKLQELVPNMDTQTNTADMIGLAISYIKDLQEQVQKLSESRSSCTCSSGKQKQDHPSA